MDLWKALARNVVSSRLYVHGIPWTAALLLIPPLAAAQEPGAVAASATAQGADAPPTLEGLQQQLDDLKRELDKTPRTGSSKNTMKIFGRTHLDYWDFPGTDEGTNVFENDDPTIEPKGGVEFRRARLGVSGEIQGNMLYKTELDFAKPDDLVFKDMYFGFEDLPVAQTLLIGNQKRPYGLDHLNSSRFNVFLERPFVVEALNQDSRRMGVAAYGTDAEQDWNWRYGAFNLTDWSRSGEYVSGNFQPEVAGRLANTFLWAEDGRRYGHWAVSGSIAFPDANPDPGDAASEARFRTRPEARSQSRWIDTGVIADADQYTLVGLEGALNFGPTQFVAEVMNSWVRRGGPSEDVAFPGAYVYVSHFLTGEHMPWDRESGTLDRPKPFKDFGKSGWGAWQVAARYSYADFTDEDVFGGEGSALTLGLNWYWNSHAGLQLNYIRGSIAGREEVVGSTTYTDGDYDILGLRFRVDF